jgi:7-cyano-7-deazaguanine synthase
MDTKAIETHIRGILEAIGEDPDREGLRETPQRVARMYEEIFAGVQYSNHEIAEMFGKTFDAPSPSQSQTAVVMKDISVFSYCEHHMALMYDMKVNVAYVPRGRVIGLSKIARICDMASKRLQLQERLGQDIAEILMEAVGTPDVGVVITGSHSCMTARGIRNVSAAHSRRITLCRNYSRRIDHMKALVLFSGGVDSTTCLGLAVDKYGADQVLALSVSYGQKHQKEVEAAGKIAAHYGVKWQQLDLSVIFADSNCSLLSGSTQEIPKETYAEQLQETNGSPVSTYVPFRNGLFLSSAASIALSNGCEVIYYGAHSDDAAGNAYPDCSTAFNDAISQAIYLGSGNQLHIEAPFVTWTKADVVKKGLELGVPYELTWSCYEGGDKPCGVCGTCRDRAAAFAANGIQDPALGGE